MSSGILGGGSIIGGSGSGTTGSAGVVDTTTSSGSSSSGSSNSIFELLTQTVVCFAVLCAVQLCVRWQRQQQHSRQQQGRNSRDTTAVSSDPAGAATSNRADTDRAGARSNVTAPARRGATAATKAAAAGTATNAPAPRSRDAAVAAAAATTKMSEDRHTISEPRLIPPGTAEAKAALTEAMTMHPNAFPDSSSSNVNSSTIMTNYDKPIFEVDIYRQGVEQPVDTVIVTDETLPPRKNRKGSSSSSKKVAWRLPDLESAKSGRLPSFGSAERKRIMELFKERKKNRKKALKRTSSAGGAVVDGVIAVGGGGADVAAAEEDNERNAGGTSTAIPASANVGSSTNGWSRGRIMAADDEAPLPELVAANVAKAASSAAAAATAGLALDASSTSASAATDGKDESNSKRASRKKKGGKDSKRNSVAESVVVEDDSAPPAPSSVLHRAPPGLSAAVTTAADSADATRTATAAADISTKAPDATTAEVNNDLPPMKSIVVPLADRPTPNVLEPNPSMSVPGAKAFIDLYYPCITNGKAEELALRYSPKAQKSVSIGGAHSVVKGRDDIKRQIASLVGSQFAVKSVVAQDLPGDDGGAFVLISGMVQTSPAAGGSISPFAHSVSLVPAASVGCSGAPGASFVIHNDAMMITPPMQSFVGIPPPPTGIGIEQQQQQGPPPGLASGFGGDAMPPGMNGPPQQPLPPQGPPGLNGPPPGIRQAPGRGI